MFGSILKLISYVILVIALLIGAFFLAVITTFLILPTLPSVIQFVIRGLVFLCFFIGFAVLVFMRKWRVARRPLLVGFVIASIATAASFLITIPFIVTRYPEIGAFLLLSLAFVAVYLLQRRIDLLATLGITNRSHVAAIEVTSIPETHTTTEDNPHSQYAPITSRILEIVNTRTYQLLATLAYNGIPCGIRLETIGNRLHLFFLTWDSTPAKLAQKLQSLAHYFQSFYPRFTIRLHSTLPNTTIPETYYRVSAHIHGEIQHTHDPLCPIAETMLQLTPTTGAIFQAFATPYTSNFLERKRAQTRFEKEAKKASKQITEPLQLAQAILASQGHQNYTHPHVGTNLETTKFWRQVERHEASVSINCHIAVATWSPQPNAAKFAANQILGSLIGVVGRFEKHTTPQIHFHRWLGRRPFNRLLHGNLTGTTTHLSIAEASCLFSIPRCDLGIPVSERLTFYTGTDDATPLLPTETPITESEPRQQALGKKQIPVRHLYHNAQLPFQLNDKKMLIYYKEDSDKKVQSTSYPL